MAKYKAKISCHLEINLESFDIYLFQSTVAGFYWSGIKNLAQGLYQKILQRWQTRYVLILYRNNSWFLTDFFPVLGWLNFCSFISRPFYVIWKLCKYFRLQAFKKDFLNHCKHIRITIICFVSLIIILRKYHEQPSVLVGPTSARLASLCKYDTSL